MIARGVEGWTRGLVGLSLGPRGRYRLEALIDEGGMAAVFLAIDANLRRRVAVKLMRPGLREDPEYIHRFEHEARTDAALDHPHILPVFDFGVTESGQGDAPAGLLYLVMRLVGGTSLRRLVASGQEPLPWTPEKVLGLARQILPALAYANRRGVIHRDLKPENILLESTPEGYHAFLADFGLATAADSDLGQSRLTHTGQILGTGFYMAPEQWQGQKPDARTDEYAFGIVLYELLTGEVPYQASTPIAVGMLHVRGELPPPKTRNEALPDAVAAVVTRALQADPERRYQTCSDLLTALATAVEDDPTKTIVQDVPALVPQTRKPEPPSNRGRREIVAGFVAACVMILLTVSVVGRAMGWFGSSGGVASAATPTSERDPLALGTPIPLLVSPTPVPRSPTLTVTPTPTVLATRAPSTTPGPVVNASGTLHQSGAAFPAQQAAGVDYRNLVAEASIGTPHTTLGPLNQWDYGLAFRSSPLGGEYCLAIGSSGRWWLEWRTLSFGLELNRDVVQSGMLSNLNKAPAPNLLRVVATGTDGFFFVNDDFVSALDLSDRGNAADDNIVSGDVAVTSGCVDSDRQDGSSTEFTRFNVSPLLYQGDGASIAAPYVLNVTASQGSDFNPIGVSASDVLVDASFNPPRGNNGSAVTKWDFGFEFRIARQAELYRLAITADDQKWWLRRVHHAPTLLGDPTPAPADFSGVASGSLPSGSLNSGRPNQLLLIAMGPIGHFFLNGGYIARLDLSGSVESGDVSIGTGFFTEYQQPRTLAYTQFGVWSPGP
jgi:serine/threonine protein kinase